MRPKLEFASVIWTGESRYRLGMGCIEKIHKTLLEKKVTNNLDIFV